MPFSNLDGDEFCLVPALNDPTKYKEFTSAHHIEKGKWIAFYDKSNKPVFINTENVSVDKKGVVNFSKVVPLNETFIYAFPTFGFRHFIEGDIHHVIFSLMIMFVARSFRMKKLTTELQSGDESGLSANRDELYGIFTQNAYYPGVAKAMVVQCLDKHYSCPNNYPTKDDNVQAGVYGVSTQSFVVGSSEPNPQTLHLVGMYLDSIATTTAQNAGSLWVASLKKSLAAGLFDCTQINEPIEPNYALSFNELTKYDMVNQTSLIRPMTVAHMIAGIRTNQNLNLPLYTWYPSSTLVGAVTQMDIMDDKMSNDNITVQQTFNTVLTYINNILMSPASQQTNIAWGSVKMYSLSFYPGYPYFNLIPYKDGQLVTYINLPDDWMIQKHSLIPYLDDTMTEPTIDDTMYAFSIFPEEFAMFEGLLLAKSYIKELKEDDGYYIGESGDVLVDTINLSYNKDGSIADCHGLDPYTTDWKKLNEFTNVDYVSSTLNHSNEFAQASFNFEGFTIGTISQKPVVMSVSSTNILDKLNDSISTALKNQDDTEITIPVYALLQVGPGEELPVTPYQSLNSREEYIKSYHKYDSNSHLYQSKYGVYSWFKSHVCTFEQYLLTYQLRFKDITKMIQKIQGIPGDHIDTITGDLFSGFKVNLKGGDIVEVKLDTFDITTDSLLQLYSRTYTGYGVFPHLVEDEDVLVFHDDSSIQIYSKDYCFCNTINISLGQTQEFTTTIIPATDLLEMYKKGKELVGDTLWTQ